MRPRLVVGLPNFHDFLADGSWHRLLDVARAADDAGVDSISVVDHVTLGGDLSGYPYGSFPGGPDGPWLEPLVTLAAFGGQTQRVRLFTGILIAPLRPPVLLAKMVATLDQLTRGRVDLGVGTGWLAKEYEAQGLDFAARGALFDQALSVCTKLWSDGAGTIELNGAAVEDVHSRPIPVQRPGVPLWIAGELHPRNLKRIVEFGSGWIPSPPAGLDAASAGARLISETLSANGRDPSSVRIRMSLPLRRNSDGRPDIMESVEAVPQLAGAGATDIFVNLTTFVRTVEDAPAFFETLVPRFAELGATDD